MDIVKAVVGIYRTGEKAHRKIVIKQGFKSAKITNISMLLSKVNQ